MQRYQARMPKLAATNAQHTLDEVDVLDRKRQGLRDAQPGTSQQPQQRPLGQRSALTGQSVRTVEQLAELSRGKQVRWLAAKIGPESMSGRNRSCRVQHGLVTSKDPDNI